MAVLLYDLPANRLLARLTNAPLFSYTTAAFSADESLFAHGEIGGAFLVWDLRAQRPVRRIQGTRADAANQLLTVWEPPMIQADLRAGGTCHLQVTAQPNRSWHIEASTDLKTWHDLGAVTNPTAKFEFIDAASPRPACCFYRVAAKD